MGRANNFAIFKAIQAEQGQFSLNSAAMPKFAETLVRLLFQLPKITPLPQQYLSKDMQHLNTKCEEDRRLTFEKCPVAFIDNNNIAEAEFYYTDHSDVVRCALCVEQIGLCQEGDNAFKEHGLWSLNCEFIRRLSVGNNPIGSSDQPTASSEQPSKSRDMCGYHFQYRPNSHPQRCKYTCLLIFLFLSVTFLPSPFFKFVLATSSRIYKHIVRLYRLVPSS